ncbi:type I restriction enzyme HsdR N-terminal domain-containing protein [Photobacterium sp. GB-27]|uniref:type I restriction enzyme HsdR N-terminal domain-containing protein n=1 Tax=Photobacterium sp. GB-27 TaxID=2022109 RepID=UPI001304C54E|nr:type I restriction enzyme HsdR N-terminal domain-containing protein [Photobacterium sp. GB-27]
MDISEKDIRDRLISKLLELGYPKSSIVLELGLRVGRSAQARIDLAISDPEANKVLAIFEIKRDSSNLPSAIQQVIGYSKLLPDDVMAFIYCLGANDPEIYSVNTNSLEVSAIYELPTFEELKTANILPKQKKEEKNKIKKNTARTWSNIVAGMSSSIAIAITVAMATGIFFTKEKTLTNSELSHKLVILENSNRQLEEKLISAKTEISQIKIGINDISALPEGHQWKAEATEIKNDLSVVASKLKALEDALTVDPSKALAVPILRKDLDNAEKSLKAELLQTRSEIDRMYDQNKWFIGLMFTIALSVLGMAASSLFNRKDT